jgi:hypothetical protein
MVPFLVVKSSIVVTIRAKGDPENALLKKPFPLADKNANAQEVAARMIGTANGFARRCLVGMESLVKIRGTMPLGAFVHFASIIATKSSAICVKLL